MTTATSSAPNSTVAHAHINAQHRLRQIAILISSVDAVAARQILHHLPTDKVRQVRELVHQLGNVSAEEKRKILAEFQRSAATSVHRNSTRTSVSGATGAAPSSLPNTQQSAYADAYFSNSPTGVVEPFDLTNNNTAARSGATTAGDSSTAQAAWTQMSTAALLRVLREERSAVIAVVVGQLAPQVAVDVLQHLPPETSREVLLRLSRLQEIDPEAMQAIDEHLAQRLQEYQHHIQSELENTRRIQSLLAAAPPSLRQDWSMLLGTPISELTTRTATQLQDTLATSEESRATAPSPQSNRHDALDLSSQPQSADILPFPGVTKENRVNPVDRGLIQLEFEQILHLPPVSLAHLLSNVDSQTVLLALAGASPEFMKRFYRMLDRQDAKALSSRLQRIGVIQLRDVDEAQRRIVEQAALLPSAGQIANSDARQTRRAA